MVSVAFAIWLFPHARTPVWAAAKCLLFMRQAVMQQATCQFARLFDSALASILHSNRGRGGVRMMSMMYQAYQNHMDLTAPWRTGAAHGLGYLNLVPQGVSDKLFGRLAAALELISRTSPTYTRPAYGIDKILVGNRELEVTEEVTCATPFGSLLHFKKEGSPDQPRMLLVEPMLGHFAILLGGTGMQR